MSSIGMKDCFFYLSGDKSGMGFRTAYKVATQTKNNKELCACVGSMICALFPGLKVKMENALNRIGASPRPVWLPAQAEDRNINLSEIPEMDWPSILVIFGFCLLVLLNDYEDETSYKAYMCNYIREMQKKIGYDPVNADLNVPFDLEKAKAIRVMLGVTPGLRKAAMTYIIKGKKISSEISSVESGIDTVCQYLYNMLSWSGMDEFNVMNEILVKPQSPILKVHDPLVSSEVENLIKACEAVASYRNPKFFMHMASDEELMKLKSSRFPTLIAVAQELERGGDGSSVAGPGTSMAGAIHALVKLHRTAMPGKVCETD